ncbi:DUF2188 domain-containing protein [Xylanimonas oleitrophica]|uniref:DUF2188 domain-containing protein n=1 Tax=Xylanimonas oleitrophica TaxID=2607479 RepID=UPI0015D05694|nr:DUF2188 domain-containing protein [Xylanimonas oleitrophica]
MNDAGYPVDGDVRTVPRDGAWVNEVRGHVVGGSFATLEDAVEAGRAEAAQRGVAHHVEDESAVYGTSARGGLRGQGLAHDGEA